MSKREHRGYRSYSLRLAVKMFEHILFADPSQFKPPANSGFEKMGCPYNIHVKMEGGGGTYWKSNGDRILFAFRICRRRLPDPWNNFASGVGSGPSQVVALNGIFPPR